MTDSSNDLYIKVLTIAANERLPSQIHDNKIAPDHIFTELLKDRYLTGRHEKSFGGGGYFANLEITTLGRQFLKKLIIETEAETIKHKAKTVGTKFLKWVLLSIGGIFIALLTAWLIKKYIG